MKTGSELLTSFVRDERGTTAIEYALVGTLIAMIILGAVGAVGTGTINLFNTVSSKTAESLGNASSQLN